MAVFDAEETRAVMVVAERSVILPPPLAAVATWKKFEKLAPVEELPVFEMTEVKVVAVPAVALVCGGAVAVRSAAEVETVRTKVVVRVNPPPVPVTVIV